MPIYQGDKKIVGRYIGETLVTRAYQGDKLIFDAYSELSGTLPLAVRSRASQVLENYRIYGESIQDGTPAPDNPVEVTGLGVRTDNLFDKKAKNTANGYVNNSYLSIRGNISISSKYYISEYIDISESSKITFSGVALPETFCCFYDDNKTITGTYDGIQVSRVPATFNVPQNAKYIRLSIIKTIESLVCLTLGSTAPTSYIPYGYQIPLKVTAGGTTTDYPIYIGDSQLMEGEYVDYEEQKIYKLVDGVLTPTDPPEPFPDITLPQGTVTIDIEGDLKPQATIKGRINPTV